MLANMLAQLDEADLEQITNNILAQTNAVDDYLY